MTGGFGTADTGPWTVSPAARFSVSGGVGSISLATAGSSTTAYLGSTSATSADVTVTLALDKRPTASAYLEVVGRRVGTNQEYDGLVNLTSAGGVQVNLRRLDGSATCNGGQPGHCQDGVRAQLHRGHPAQCPAAGPGHQPDRVAARGVGQRLCGAGGVGGDHDRFLAGAAGGGIRRSPVVPERQRDQCAVVQTVRAFSGKPVG